MMQPSRHAKRSSKRHYGTSVNTVNLGLNYGIAGNSVSGTNQNAASQKLGPSDDFNMIARNQPQLHNRSYSTGLPKSRVLSPPRNNRPNSGDSFFDMKSDEQQKIGTLVGKTSWQTMNSYNTRIKANQSTNKTSFPSSQNVSQTYNHQKELSQEIQRVANSTSQMNQSSPHFYLPGDKVIFTEDSSAPGIPVIYRIEEERRTNPDKLNLDRRGLVVCPILEGEENLRLLNFQHNLIRKIENLGMLRKLIFLDLYDNQIEEISGLSWLRSLRVLMLGKNRLRKIDNLHDLSKLDVLDLHGNKIAKIENLSHLLELRVLNLAGNELIKINKLHGLESLTELNLRRNKITSVNEIDELPSLQRLFLSYNDIRNFQDISCLSKSTSLTELSLDGNPLTNESNYKQIILHNVTSIKQLDMKKISDEERRITSVMARKEDEKRREFEKISTLKERRQLAINNAKCQYEAQFEKGSNDISAKSTKSLAEKKTPRDRSTTPKLSSVGTDYSVCHLAELDDNRLNFYGSGSLEAVDRNWGEKAASSVIYVSFHFINFDQIVPYLAKIKSRFVNITNICFAETNLCHLSQINALAVLRNLSELTINETGNPVTEFNLWKPYVLFRLAHLSLQTINGCEVTTSDSVHAEKMFGALGHVTTSQLSQSRLITMLAKQKKSGIIQDNSRLEATTDFFKRDKSTNSGEPVNRAGLMHHSLILSRLESEDSKQGKRFARNYMNEIVKSVAVTEDKQEQFERIWPEFFSNLLEKSVKEMSDIDQYMELSLENIKAR